MALHYPTQRKIEALKTTQNGSNSPYLSDMRVHTFGGRGGLTDERNFLNMTLDTAEPRLSDAWVSFGALWVSDGNNRFDQNRRISYESGSLQ